MSSASGLRRSRILGTGHYLPAKVLTNADLEKTVNTSDEWITSRTGIRQRHIAAPDEFDRVSSSGFALGYLGGGLLLLLNLAWTPLFFAADLYSVALVEIIVLAASVALLVAWSWHRSRAAAWLLVPYLAWVCFATALNAGIVVLN